jgi:hypothetical protein
LPEEEESHQKSTQEKMLPTELRNKTLRSRKIAVASWKILGFAVTPLWHGLL